MSSTQPVITNFTCEICFDPFDLETRLPKLLACCGKSLCRMCLQKNLQTGKMKCPWSKHAISADITTYKTNLQLLSIIEEEIKWERCPQHADEKLKFLCMEDQARKCGHCIYATDCKYHKLIPLLDLKADSEKRLKILQGHLSNVDNQSEKYNKLICQNKPVLQDMVEKSFEEQIFQLKKARVKTMMELTSAFSKKQSEISNQYGQNSSLRAELQAKVFNHMNILKAKNPVETMQEDLALLKTRVDSLIGGGQDLVNFEQGLSKMTMTFQKDKVNAGFDELLGQFKAGIGAARIGAAGNLYREEGEIEVQGKKMALEISGDMKQLSIMGSLQDKTITLDLGKVREAKEVSIDTRNFEFNEGNLKAIGSILEKMSQINKVSFTSGCNFEVKLDRISELFSMVFRKPREVTSISINLPKNDDILMLLNMILPQLSSLKELIVAFPANVIDARICENFIEGFVLVAGRLEHLNLNISLTNFPVTCIKRIFVPMPLLNKFSLNVSKVAGLNDKVLMDVTQNLQALMPKIAELNFDISGTCCKMNNLPGLNYIPKAMIFSDVPVKMESTNAAAPGLNTAPLEERAFTFPRHQASSNFLRNSRPRHFVSLEDFYRPPAVRDHASSVFNFNTSPNDLFTYDNYFY